MSSDDDAGGTVPPEIDENQAVTFAFLQQLYGGLDPENTGDEPYWFYIFRIQSTEFTLGKPKTESAWFTTSQEGFLAATMTAHSIEWAKSEVYYGVNVARSEGTPHTRITNQTAAALTAVVADIDVASKVHTKAGLPPSQDEAERILESVGFEPSVVINSGHGLQAIWMLNEPWIIGSDSDLQSATEFNLLWHSSLAARAGRLGYTVDPVNDLARIMRLPGTWNRKDTPVRVVNLLWEPERRFEPSELEAAFLSPGELSLTARHPRVVAEIESRARQGRTAISGVSPSAARALAREEEPLVQELLKDIADVVRDGDSQSEKDMSAIASLVRRVFRIQQVGKEPMDWQTVIDIAILRRILDTTDDKPRKVDRPSYWLATLSKCTHVVANMDADEADGLLVDFLSRIEKSEVPVPLDEQFESHRVGTEAYLNSIEHQVLMVEHAIDPEEKAKETRVTVEKVSEILGIQIIRIDRYPADTGTSYRVHVPGGVVRLENTEAILNQKTFIARIADATKIVLPPMKPQDWLTVAAAVLRCSEDIEIGEDASEEKIGIRMMRGFLEDYPPTPYTDEVGARIASLKLDNGYYGISRDHLIRWKHSQTGQNLQPKRLSEILSAAGARNQDFKFRAPNGKDTSRPFWVIHRQQLGIGYDS